MTKTMGADSTVVGDILAIRTGAIAGDPPGPTLTALQSLGHGWGFRNLCRANGRFKAPSPVVIVAIFATCCALSGPAE